MPVTKLTEKPVASALIGDERLIVEQAGVLKRLPVAMLPSGGGGTPGRGIASVDLTGTDGDSYTFTVTYTDGTTSTLQIPKTPGSASGVTSVNGKTGAVTMPSLGFGTCASGETVRDKVITGVDSTLPLIDGTTLTVRFTTANTASSPRLTVNGETSIIYDWRTSQPLTADSLGACTHHFVMYGGAWVLLNPVVVGGAGTPGEKGEDGTDGGYYAPSVTADGVLSWAGSKSDMPPVQSANIKGTPGLPGADGEDGKSAYQLAVEAGFTGTLSEWLASLKGAQGEDGADGAAGTPGADGGYYTPSVSDNGELIFTASKTGMPPVATIDLHEYISTILPGGYCSTGVAVADKIESYINKEITAGSLVAIQFANTNTANNPTLTVNGVKAAIVGGDGTAISPTMLGAGERVFLYTTAQKWLLINPQVSALPTATAADAGKAAIVGSDGAYTLAYPQYPVVRAEENNVTMQPNTYYNWGVMDSLTISFGDETPRIVNEYCGEFASGSTATTFSVPLSVEWVGGLNIEAGKRYQFSIINGIGVMVGV